MKKFIMVLLGLLLTLGLATPSYAKDTTASLKKQIAQLKSTNKKLSTENNSLKSTNQKLSTEITSLKKKVPTVSTGKIYKDGVQSGSSNIVTMDDKNYVEINNIIPLLTNYDDTKINFIRSTHNLYLGIQPRNGIINFLNLKQYETDGYIDTWYDGSHTINGKRISTGLILREGNWYGGYGGSSYFATYKINSLYSTMKFKFGLSDESESNTGTIKVYGDDNLLFDSGDIERLDNPKEASIDVTGIKYLKITFFTKEQGYPIIGEPVLIP